MAQTYTKMLLNPEGFFFLLLDSCVLLINQSFPGDVFYAKSNMQQKCKEYAQWDGKSR